MKNLIRGLVLTSLAAAATTAGLVGCSTSTSGDKEDLGEIGLPLTTQGPSGARYRLRNATFDIQSGYYGWKPGGFTGGGGSAGAGTTLPPPALVSVSSEDNPDRKSVV